jgi:hypothetical protein
MADDIANLTLRLFQDMRAESAARDEMLRAEISELRAEVNAKIDAFRNEANSKFDILAEASVRQSSRMEMLSIVFNRHGERFGRIEARLDRIDQRLGLDQKTH